MRRKTLPRLAGSGWAHPYGTGPFSPFLYADGGDGDGSGSSNGDGDGSGGDGDSGDGDGGGSGDGSGKDTGQGKSGKGGDDLAATVKRLEKELAYARGEAGKARTAAKQQAADDAVKELTQQLGKALGFVKDDDTPPDPKALAEAIAQKDTTISEKESALRAKDVELAVWARADKLQARAGALLDSRSFVSTLAELDPSEKGFTTALDSAIKDAVKDNPAFAVQTAGKSGGDLSGATGEAGAKKRGGSLSGAIANHYQT
ncbi:hypothetical protein GKQ77_01660 [Streptomyces sp. BG9H]|uniref:Scaffolding protein n=1 Tax=Streptomyces anatolicus TaxID=2675858 RepID=A0ABS6YFU8_9ACTN|nr:hypothetical protein [Streptomyces anatolicus]MBW5420277.1 hypothetical protein [Streptomyces anatolicus]